MTAALIVIEVAAPQVSDDALAVLVSSCTRAARDAECALTKNASDEQPSSVAIVSLQSEDKMRVEVGVHQGDHDSWRTKDFAFLPADDPLDRWRAIGFAIGTLAESNPQPRADAPKEAAPKPPPEQVVPLAPAPPTPHWKRESGAQLFVGAAAIFGPGLDRGPWRLGGALSADLAPSQIPIFVTIGATAATRVTSDASNATARWFDLSTGLGMPLLGPISSSGLELRGSVVAEYFDVNASTFGHYEANSRWTLGCQASLGGRLEILPNLLLTAEVLATGFSGSTEVRVAGKPIGSTADFRYLGSLGLRVRLR